MNHRTPNRRGLSVDHKRLLGEPQAAQLKKILGKQEAANLKRIIKEQQVAQTKRLLGEPRATQPKRILDEPQAPSTNNHYVVLFIEWILLILSILKSCCPCGATACPLTVLYDIYVHLFVCLLID